MEIAFIVFLVCGFGLILGGWVYAEETKPNKKLHDYVVVADDGDDE